MKKKILIFILALVMTLIFVPGIASAANTTEFAGGSGTAKDPFLISTKTQLNNVRKYLDAHFKLKCDIVFTDADFAVGGAFYNGGAGWTPIGRDDTPFTGTFDGNGYVVKNLYVNVSNSLDNINIYAGFFGYNKGIIKNLGIVDGDISAKAVGRFSNAYAGGIAGCNEGSITGCHNTGPVSATSSRSATYAGGIAGRNNNYGSITGCYNTGNVSVTTESFYAFIGGIAGYSYNGSSITGCHNTGAISATASNVYTGGITGYNEGSSITGSYNTGAVSAKSSDDSGTTAFSGGIAGYNYEGSNITDSYNTGKVSATAVHFTYAGGITGYNYNGTTITGCYNTGNVLVTGDSRTYAGGIAGRNEGGITGCYNAGAISTTSQNSNANAGGIVAGSWNGTIAGCYNIGKVSAKTFTSEYYFDAYAGGIAGFNSGSTITNCYYLDTISVGVVEGSDTAKKCTAKQMQTKSTYVGFDFAKTWDMSTNSEYKYPLLKSINPYKIVTATLSATSYTYNGKVKAPTVSVKNAVGKTLTKGTDYTVTYASGRINVGTYKVTVKGKGNYSFTKTLTFKINPIKASNCAMKLSTYTYTYNGKVKAPTVKITSPTGSTLTKGTSYTVSYEAGRRNVGTYKVTVTMKGNYTGTKTQTFKINPIKASNCAMKLSTYTYTYDGKVKAPTVKITSPTGSTLTKGTSYTVSYEAGRRNVGTYKVTVTMKGNYTGTKTQSFKINPIKVSNCSVKLSTTAYTYNGKVKTPTVKVISPTGSTLTKGSSYTVTYASGRKNVGTYKVTVKMKGNYTGTKTLTFKISPPATTVSKLTAGSKSITVGITKKTSQVTGYQIQYSTSKTFSSATTKTISGYNTTSCTLKGLSAQKTYFVRVRTYKTVNNTTYYSGWSTYKYVKTK